MGEQGPNRNQKNGGEELAAAAPRGRVSARAVSVEEEEVRVVAVVARDLMHVCMCHH